MGKKSNITAADATVVGITNKITLPTTGVVRTITGMRRDVDRRVVTRTADMDRRVDTPTVTATTMAVITIKDGNKRKGIEIELKSLRILRGIVVFGTYFEKRKKKDRI